MNQPVKNKKPFGLSLACKIAAEALKQSVAPTSIVLGNLIYLQQDTLFPKELDTHFFSFQKKPISDIDKRLIATLLDELKKPQDNVASTLEKFIAPNWVTKKIVPNTNKTNLNEKKINQNKNQLKKKPIQTKQPKVEANIPVVVVKKSKLSI